MSETPSSKISELPLVVAANVLETDFIPGVFGGITSRIAISQLRSKFELSQSFNVKHPNFGAVGDGVADDTAAIQAAINAANTAAISRIIAVPADVGALSYAVPHVYFPLGVYKISAQLNIGYAGSFLFDPGSFIKQTNDAVDVFATTTENGYQIQFRGGGHIIAKRRHIVLTRSNIDVSMNLIEDMAHSGPGDAAGAYPAIYLSTQSCNTVIRRPRNLSKAFYLDNVLGDKIELVGDGGWINGYTLTDGGTQLHKPANTASIVHRSTGEMTVNGVIFVPEPDTYGAAKANTRWFDNYSSLRLVDNHFGSENGGFPEVYNFGSAKSIVFPYISGTKVEILGGMAYGGASGRVDRGLIVCITGVPATILVKGVRGPSDSKIINTANMLLGDLVTPVTLAAWLASVADAQNPKIAIEIECNETWGTVATDIVPTELQKQAVWEHRGVNGAGNTRFNGPRLVVGSMAENTSGASLQSSGLTFPAAQAASADPNTLDDYEEADPATLPTLTFGGATPVGIAFAIQKITYTKKGREVTAQIFLALSNRGANPGAGAAEINNLPFTVRNDDAGYAPAVIRADTVTFVGLIQGYAPKNTTKIVLEQMTEAGVLTPLTWANFVNASALLVRVTYNV